MAGSYPPPHYNEPDFEAHLQLMREQPLATFIVADSDVPFATPLPLVLAHSASLKAGFSEKGNQMQLLGHLDANNPAADLIQDGREVLAIYHGPNAYISPTDYHTKGRLPTYNYKQVFVRGKLQRLTDHADVQADLHALVKVMEPEGKWDISNDDPRIKALLPHIVGFRIHVESVTGRFKLSQDKVKADREAAMQKLTGKL
ncbi:MAG: FMN-binding negative transcriptional regulator [Saprospiraceae bacterium]